MAITNTLRKKTTQTPTPKQERTGPKSRKNSISPFVVYTLPLRRTCVATTTLLGLRILLSSVPFFSPPLISESDTDFLISWGEEQNPESRTLLPGIAFADFARRFEEPTLAEGFEDITRVEFRFEGDEDSRKVWGQFWVWFYPPQQTREVQETRIAV